MLLLDCLAGLLTNYHYLFDLLEDEFKFCSDRIPHFNSGRGTTDIFRPDPIPDRPSDSFLNSLCLCREAQRVLEHHSH